MAHFFFPITCMAALGAGLIYGKINQPPKPTAEPAAWSINDSHKDARVWILSNKRTSETCLVFKTRQVSGTTVALNVDQRCDNVFAGSELISVWQEDREGNVSLGDEQGNAIAEFAYSTETGLISISAEPGSLTLSPTS